MGWLALSAAWAVTAATLAYCPSTATPVCSKIQTSVRSNAPSLSASPET